MLFKPTPTTVVPEKYKSLFDYINNELSKNSFISFNSVRDLICKFLSDTEKKVFTCTVQDKSFYFKTACLEEVILKSKDIDVIVKLLRFIYPTVYSYIDITSKEVSSYLDFKILERDYFIFKNQEEHLKFLKNFDDIVLKIFEKESAENQKKMPFTVLINCSESLLIELEKKLDLIYEEEERQRIAEIQEDERLKRENHVKLLYGFLKWSLITAGLIIVSFPFISGD